MKDKGKTEFIEADESWLERIRLVFGENAARHVHLQAGFTLLALTEGEPVGLLSAYWRTLPPPLVNCFEGYIDIIEVLDGFRRRGLAARMLEIAGKEARAQGAYQLRAWSSEDKVEAIPMWRHLGFGLCPAVTYPDGKEVSGYFVTRVL